MIFQGRKQKWQQIQGEVAQEYDVVKNIMQTLALFKGKNKVKNICLVRYLVHQSLPKNYVLHTRRVNLHLLQVCGQRL